MAKMYDFKSAKRYIQMHSDIIDEVSLGMKEDWWWTAETLYENSRFILNLDTVTQIAGISGSPWATPAMRIVFKDGTEVFKDCYIGESTEQKPEWFSLGCLSQPMQDRINSLTKGIEYKKEETSSNG